jgi:hypothetical protein
MTFKHLVGKSTLKEGITIHKNFESFFESPDLGQKKDITLVYANNQSVQVVLRRLNNVRKHVQIKYTSKTQASFVDWLNDIFAETRKGTVGEFLEVEKMSSDVFKLIPITKDMVHNAKLYIADSMYHKTDKERLSHNDSFLELERVINGISFKVNEGQAF